jgi:haloalkane dehalogenase
MIEAEETFGGTWPYAPQYFAESGFRQHFVDEGPRNTGETFVCLHGEPTWGYIYRNFVPRLSELGRVIIPDHMGFGKSETPQDREYSVMEHCDNLDALLLSLDARDVTLIGQDWGGPIGTHFATRHPERIKRFFYIDSFPRLGVPANIDMAVLAREGATPWAEFFTSEAFDPVMSHLGRSILSILKLVGFTNHDVITDEWLRAYSSPFPTPESCKGAKAFPMNTMNPAGFTYLEEAIKQPGITEALREKPAMAVMGEHDRTLPKILAEGMFREIWEDAPFITLPGVGHFAQEDAPITLVSMIEQFVRSR